MRFILARENARRDARDASSADNLEKHDGDSVTPSAEERDKEYERIEREDLTDKENMAFRYTL